jgi:hypothetical protein
MMDHHRTSVPEGHGAYRSNGKSKLATEDDIEKNNCPGGKVDIIAMVRSLQRTAGTTDCFRMGNADCDIIDCDWRIYCLETPANPRKNGKATKPK